MMIDLAERLQHMPARIREVRCDFDKPAACVGKTFAMLNEGRRRKARGTDVVIGYVEAHKRPLTEQNVI